MDRQKAAFFSLSDAEREIAGVAGEPPAKEAVGAREDQ